MTMDAFADADEDRWWGFKLPSGNTLVISVCPRSWWQENKDAHHLGNDFGYFLMEHAKDLPRVPPQILAKFATVDAAYEAAEMLAKFLPAGGGDDR